MAKYLIHGRIIDAASAEHFRNCRNVGGMAVSRELKTSTDLRLQKAEKFVGRASASVANMPTGHKFRIGAHCDPSPRIPKPLRFHLSSAILLFGISKRP